MVDTAMAPVNAGDGEHLTKSDYEALARFRYGIRRFLRFSENAVRSQGLMPQQYQLLLAIKGFPGRDWGTITELAERLQLKHHSAVGLVSRCVAAGYVTRNDHPTDRRVAVIRLTDRGEEILEQLANIHRAELARMKEFLRVPAFAESEEYPC
jgi:DNA-binding MarR family transcriptional regulator